MLPWIERAAAVEADALRGKIEAGEAATYAEAEQLLAREEFQKTLARKAKGRDQLRPKWKKWLGISKTAPTTVAMEQALKENERIDSLVGSGKAQNTIEAIERLRRMESSVTSSSKEQDLAQRAIL